VDEHSSEVGFDTRLEAFVDMLVRKKDKRLA
jgi:predicted nucleotide-binding protein (sugar kinase/HSP70/actin superfamily)